MKDKIITKSLFLISISLFFLATSFAQSSIENSNPIISFLKKNNICWGVLGVVLLFQFAWMFFLFFSKKSNKKIRSKLKKHLGKYNGLNDKVKAYEALQQKEKENEYQKEMIETLVTNLPIGFFAKNPHDRTFFIWNKKMEEIIGVKAKEAIAKTTKQIFPQHMSKKLKQQDDKAIRTKKIVDDPFFYVSYQGRKEIYHIIKVPLLDVEGNVICILGLLEDITEKLKMENELRHAQKMEAIGQLASGIAHEINTPTQFIWDNTTFISENVYMLINLVKTYRKIFEEEQRTGEKDIEAIKEAEAMTDMTFIEKELPLAVEHTKEGVERISSIVAAMKDFSFKGDTFKKQKENINDAVKTIVSISRNEWKYDCQMQLDLDPNISYVECFIGDIKQVILNLILNAVYAIKDKKQKVKNEQGLIRIFTKEVNNKVIIGVSDTGTGIDENIKEKVFEPFFTTKSIGKGTGQGLSMAYALIVGKHKGNIYFETDKELGCTFFVELPIG